MSAREAGCDSSVVSQRYLNMMSVRFVSDIVASVPYGCFSDEEAPDNCHEEVEGALVSPNPCLLRRRGVEFRIDSEDCCRG